MINKEGKYVLEKPLDETMLLDKLTPEIARITLNRPEKHNALLPPDSFLEAGRKVTMAANDDDVKVIIIRGAGESFCTGDDLNVAPYEAFGGGRGVKPSQRARLKGFQEMMNGFIRVLTFCPKIIICQVHGWCIAGGLWFVLPSDITIAAETARFAHREQRIGFAGLDSGTLLLHILTLGYKRTREWLLTGRALSAQEAKEWGLVNAVVPDDKLEDETMRWAKAIALQAGDGLVIGKTHTQICLDMLGLSGSVGAGYMAHSFFTNLKWGPDEFNFLNVRDKKGITNTFKIRENRWGELGF